MVWTDIPLLLLFFVAGAISAFFTVIFWKNRASTVGAVPLSIAMVGMTLSAWSTGIRLTGPDPVIQACGRIIQIVVMVIVPVAVILFALQYSGRVRRPIPPSVWAPLLAIPAIAATILFTSTDLHLIPIALPWSPGSTVFWLFAIYNELLVLAAILLVVQCYRTPAGIFQGQLACLLIAILVPSFLHVAYLYRIAPFAIADLAPIGGIVTVVALSAGIRRFSLFDIVPVNHVEVFRQVPAGIIIIDAAGRIIEINPAALWMLGIADGDITGRHIGTVLRLGGEMLPGNGPPSFTRPFFIQREIGDVTCHIEVRSIPVVSPLGVSQNRLILLSDVTDQKLTEQSLNMARRNINLLTAITRHDILNQLTVIILHNEILLADVTDEKLLKSIMEQEKAAKNISRQIAFTKEYEQLGENLPEWLDIGKIILKHTEALGYDYIHYSIHVEGLEVFCDPLIDRVFYNFLDNSFRYGQKVTSIRIYTIQHLEGLSIFYEDNGIGIPEKDKNRIFQRGFARNAGFGLFFSREILSITGITIKETGQEGSGVRFEIMVPWGRFRFQHNGTAGGGEKAE